MVPGLVRGAVPETRPRRTLSAQAVEVRSMTATITLRPTGVVGVPAAPGKPFFYFDGDPATCLADDDPNTAGHMTVGVVTTTLTWGQLNVSFPPAASSAFVTLRFSLDAWLSIENMQVSFGGLTKVLPVLPTDTYVGHEVSYSVTDAELAAAGVTAKDFQAALAAGITVNVQPYAPPNSGVLTIFEAYLDTPPPGLTGQLVETRARFTRR